MWDPKWKCCHCCCRDYFTTALVLEGSFQLMACSDVAKPGLGDGGLRMCMWPSVHSLFMWSVLTSPCRLLTVGRPGSGPHPVPLLLFTCDILRDMQVTTAVLHERRGLNICGTRQGQHHSPAWFPAQAFWGFIWPLLCHVLAVQLF